MPKRTIRRSTPELEDDSSIAYDCPRCGTVGLIPYWILVPYVDQFTDPDGELVTEDRERFYQLNAKCPCVNGTRWSGLRDIDSIKGIPRGLSAFEMNLIIGAMIANPGLAPAEAVNRIPKSRAELIEAFKRMRGDGREQVGKKIARTLEQGGERFVPDRSLRASWERLRDALDAADEALTRGLF